MEAEPRTVDAPKSKRRWFQFSLRTLMIFVLVVAVAASWLGGKFEQKRKEREAVDALREAGGNVLYDFEAKGSQPPGPVWLRSWLGKEYFATVVEAYLGRTTITDDDLAALASVPTLETLDISDTRVTGAGLRHVAMLRNLKSLSLRNGATTWAAHHRTSNGYILSTVLSFQDSRGRTIVARDDVPSYHPRITDASLGYLGTLTNLESLDLEGTDVTGTGIAKLRDLSHLKYLNVRGTNVSEAAIADLKRAIPQLKVDKYFPPTVSSDQIGGPLVIPEGTNALIDFGASTRSGNALIDSSSSTRSGGNSSQDR